MTAREIVAAARLAAVAAAGITSRVQDVHHAVATRAFGAAGVRAQPLREIHDAISSTVYGQVRMGVGAGLALAGVTDAGIRAIDTGDAVPSSLSDRRILGSVLALVNGWTGDRLHAAGDVLATPMAVRSGGRSVQLRSPHLAAAFPAASARLVVFLHGLVDTETSWWPRREDARSFGDRLEADLGVTAVYVRYNSGRHISENGQLLSSLLDELVEHWPVPVTDLALVGHSMGGLVARSAVHQAGPGSTWLCLLRATVSLGSPHLGAPLERAVNELEHGLALWPESRPFATLLTQRSSGIKDLRFGDLVAADWDGQDPARRRNGRTLVPLAAQSPHFVVYGTFTRRPDHRMARAVGDLMVLPASATGDGRHHPPWELPAEQVLHVGGLHHLQLLHHPQVYDQLRTWLHTQLMLTETTATTAQIGPKR